VTVISVDGPCLSVSVCRVWMRMCRVHVQTALRSGLSLCLQKSAGSQSTRTDETERARTAMPRGNPCRMYGRRVCCRPFAWHEPYFPSTMLERVAELDAHLVCARKLKKSAAQAGVNENAIPEGGIPCAGELW
jgi:hypothetical protein